MGGYTIPLDKRLAADGRGLQQVHINENFSKLAEALYIADRKAREAVEMRASLEKEAKEAKLRELAQKARDERAGFRPSGGGGKDEGERERDDLRRERHQDRQRQRNIERAAPERRGKL